MLDGKKILILLLVVLVLYMGHVMSLQNHKAVLSKEIKALEVSVENATYEYQRMLEEHKKLIEENGRFKERLSHYEKLSGYIQDRLKKANPGTSTDQIGKLTSLFWDQVKEYEFDPWEAASWIFQESEFKIKAVSPKGAVGLTQIMPTTGKQVAGWLGIKWEGKKTLLDPEKNMLIGFYHLNWGRKLVSTEHQVYTIYLWGIGNLKRMKLNETKYSSEILDRARKLKTA